MNTRKVTLDSILLRLGKLETKMDALCNTVSELKAEFEEQVISSGKKMSAVATRILPIIKNLDEHFILDRKNRELIMNGIPMKTNEKLEIVYRSIISALGFETDKNENSSPMARLFRLPGKETVIMEFPSEFYKNQLLEKYFLAPRSLTLDKIEGFNGKSRIFISQNLTKQNYEINKAAFSLKMDGKIDKIKILDGRVNVVSAGGQGFKVIRTLDELRKL